MGRWAQRRRGATDRTVATGTPVARIIRVFLNGGGPTVAVAEWDTVVTGTTAGLGDLENLNTGEGAPVLDQIAPTWVRYFPYVTPLTVGDAWTLPDTAGLTFAGGATPAAGQSGFIT
jgi:hypothetical protein